MFRQSSERVDIVRNGFFCVTDGQESVSMQLQAGRRRRHWKGLTAGMIYRVFSHVEGKRNHAAIKEHFVDISGLWC